jgi:long-chain acyl-CoA synthetase
VARTPGIRNLADVLHATAAVNDTAVGLIDGDTQRTWAEVDQAVDHVAAGLIGHGVSPGDTVAIVLPNGIPFVEAYFAVLRAGAVAAPLNPALTATELATLLSGGKVSLVIAGGHALSAVREAVASMDADQRPHLVVVDEQAGDGESDFAALHASTDEPVEAPTGGEDVAVLLFTSGASSSPRAAMLSHRALMANLDQVAALQPAQFTADDVILGLLPTFHVYGLNAVIGLAARVGAAVVLTDRFDPEETLALVERAGVTVAPVAPPILMAWAQVPGLRNRLRGVRLLLSGAAALPVSVQEEIQTATGHVVHQGYGLTEASPVATTTLASPVAKPGSIGRPIPGVEIRLVDEVGEDVEDGDPGEILLRGQNLFSGYWPDGVDGPDAEGWWHTGDVAYADADGDLFLVDRIKDLVIVNGFNVYPREVEEVLLEMPGVAEAAVVAVPHPTRGETVKAVVVPAPGADITPEAVAEFCSSRLARFKQPTVVDVVGSLPRTATGKIAKGLLRRTSVSVPGVR